MGSWLFGNNASVNNPTPPATALRIQTSVQGRAIAILGGTNRIAANLIWQGDFASRDVEVGSVGSSGWFDHIFSKAQPIIQTAYSASCQFALCHGPIIAVLKAWNGTTATTADAIGFTTFFGYYEQDAWSWLVTNHPDAALAYRGIAYLAQANFQLGTSPNLPVLNWEVEHAISGYGPETLDADAADVVLDVVSSPHYGIEFPWYRFDQYLTAYWNYSGATGMVVSPPILEAASAQNLLSDLLEATNSSARWSSGVMTIVPWGDADITANGFTFTADVTPIYDLDADSFLPDQSSIGSGATTGGEPITCVLRRRSDMLNVIKVEYLDRSNNYDPVEIDRKDEASIIDFTTRASDLKTRHMFALADAADQSASLELIREQIPATWSFTLPPGFIMLDVEDIVTLTRPTIGLDEHAVRITEITENDDSSLSFTAEDFMGTAAAPLYGTQSSSGNNVNQLADPGGLADVVIFTAPDALANPPAGNVTVVTAVCGVDHVNFGGCNVYLSVDAVNFNAVGVVLHCNMGFLSTDLPNSADPDVTNTPGIDLTESDGALPASTDTSADNGVPPCFVDNEIITYGTATLTSANNYDLDYLRRGAFGSTSSDHDAGSSFVLVDNNIYSTNFPTSMIGTTVYFKFQPFNIYQGGVNPDLSILTVYPYTIGDPVPFSPPAPFAPFSFQSSFGPPVSPDPTPDINQPLPIPLV